MILRCLLFSDDERAVRLLRASLGDLSIEVEHTTKIERAQELLLRQKFDGVVSDCDLIKGPELLRLVRRSKHNRRSIIFALTNMEIKMSEAFEMGAHFVIYKPITSERVKRTLNAAHGLMMREKRQHFRHPARTPAMLRIGQRSLTVEVYDLSQHGALIHAGTPLKKEQPVQLTFTLPETSFELEVGARVTRSDSHGKTGVRFESLTEGSQTRLLQWAVQRSMEEHEAPSAKRAATAATTLSVPLSPPPPMPPEPEVELVVDLDDNISGVDFEVEVITGHDSEIEDEDTRQRHTLRGQHHAALKILTFDNGLPAIIQGKCRNISELGLAARVEEELGLGDAVLLQVDLPGASKPVVLHASVRHREEDRYGFEFVAIDPAVKDMLRRCVSDLPVE
jgi:DNA-binding response OmpR family regulator